MAKGEATNPHRVEHWLEILSETVADIVEVTVACLTNPAAIVVKVIHKVTEKAKEEIA